MLQGHTVADSNNDGGPQFAEVFVVVWVGALVITVNSKLLGGTMWVPQVEQHIVMLSFLALCHTIKPLMVMQMLIS